MQSQYQVPHIRSLTTSSTSLCFGMPAEDHLVFRIDLTDTCSDMTGIEHTHDVHGDHSNCRYGSSNSNWLSALCSSSRAGDSTTTSGNVVVDVAVV